MEWKEVKKDGFPDVNKKANFSSERATVIAYNGHFVFPIYYEREVVRGKTIYRWKWIFGSGAIYNSHPITHWMPLPTAPKTEEDH